jgi:hypothetical protein
MKIIVKSVRIPVDSNCPPFKTLYIDELLGEPKAEHPPHIIMLLSPFPKIARMRGEKRGMRTKRGRVTSFSTGASNRQSSTLGETRYSGGIIIMQFNYCPIEIVGVEVVIVHFLARIFIYEYSSPLQIGQVNIKQ